ncbi:MAG: pantoate--beta-alanine ligase [Bacteroidales bacterium]|nr:pantoate--beta-alanine ligase [Bacteroidales bacterium]MBD5342574.1 pantoate--beta-alanine ligase [Bacteroides sp.]MBD5372577.1 pantoate--beta-alanine ligase [Bacteroides sp.]MDE6032806.1 pantoate--beta-alanine ligase [Muribaculaceae bacterium]
MKVIRTVNELKAWSADVRSQGLSLGFVPTMGALHAGHMSLVTRARSENDRVAVSVFVNPTQFNNPTDLATYPRTEEADLALLESAGVDVAFVPTVEEMYPEPDTRVFDLGPVAEVMEGAMRPGHFNGVAQVVSRLFEMVQPTRAYFGEKDFQQIAVIRRMVELEGGFGGLEIVDVPIKREDDGLAMSSRNVRLTPEMRQAAPAIRRALLNAAAQPRTLSPAEVIDLTVKEINAVSGLETEYFQIVDGHTCQPVTRWEETDMPVGCITVYAGDVRLIDNIKF